MVDYKSLCHLTILLLSLCFMLVHCSLEPADQFLDNPTDVKEDALSMHKRPSFFVGSRYGRSGGGSSSSSSGGGGAYAPSKSRRLNVVPRNDRFFLGSRYGKRAGTLNANQLPLASTLLSTPYEQALFSEISTGTQLSNKPGDNHLYSSNGRESSNNNSPAASYMSCVYTGLQNFYRCNSIDKTSYLKNTAPFYKNDAVYNDGNGNGYDNDNDDDEDDDEEQEEEEEEEENDDAVNGVLSTDATGSGGRINDADIRNDGGAVEK